MPLASTCLPELKEKFDKSRLMKETEVIKKHFSDFLASLHQYIHALLENRTLADLSVLKNQMVMYDRKLKVPLNESESLQDVFKILNSPEHSSFLDYELVKVIVDFSNVEMKSKLVEYKRKLQNFLKNRMISTPTQNDSASYAIVVDNSITEVISDPVHLLNRVRMVLGHPNLILLTWESLGLQLKEKEESVITPDVCGAALSASEVSTLDEIALTSHLSAHSFEEGTFSDSLTPQNNVASTPHNTSSGNVHTLLETGFLIFTSYY